ncbi:IpaD/SipD/SspD family type III secretion system needle tip protein [Stenotrophomonas sp. PS02289]|uniref:IpaD/SipD/SspD family type III secretion system needle tip protein n=1 Tax=Stenotrophomonas sp. PS02289 TaxID=2991422 RepID=UPI00249A2A0C|nr:IpaD/SipD/SspD family type III secretion system needle tip protein [Stenotrophomonas sp. PS02289]
MTSPIQSAPTCVAGRHAHALVRTDVKHDAEPLNLDPATVAKLGQAQVFLENAHSALERQKQAAMRYTAQLKPKQQPSQALAAQLNAAIDDSRRANADLLRVLGFLDFRDTRDTRESDRTREVPTTDDGMPMEDPATKDASGLVWDSHSEFYDQIATLLSALKQNWLSKYQDAMKKFLEFYKEFSDALENLKPEGSGDKGDVKINFQTLYDKLQEILVKYGNQENALGSFPTKAAAQAFIDSLGLPGLEPVLGADGEFKVMINLTDVKAISESTDKGATVTWDSAKYNAWVSAKDGNVEQIKHVSKVLGEKLSETTQQFDNIVKILSSTIDKITDADMSFVNGL